MLDHAKPIQRPERPLSTYRIAEVEMPNFQEVRRFICPGNHTIYINANAEDGAKIDRIIPLLKQEQL